MSIRQKNLPRRTQTQLHVYIALVLTGESTEGWSVGEPRLPFPRSTSRTCGCRLQGPSSEVVCGQREFNKQRGEEEEERLSVKAAVGTRGKYSPRLPALPTPGLGDQRCLFLGGTGSARLCGEPGSGSSHPQDKREHPQADEPRFWGYPNRPAQKAERGAERGSLAAQRRRACDCRG